MKKHYEFKPNRIAKKGVYAVSTKFEYKNKDVAAQGLDNLLSRWLTAGPNLMPFLKDKKPPLEKIETLKKPKPSLINLIDNDFINKLTFWHSVSKNSLIKSGVGSRSGKDLLFYGNFIGDLNSNSASYGSNLLTLFRNHAFKNKKENFYKITFEVNDYKFFKKFLSARPAKDVDLLDLEDFNNNSDNVVVSEEINTTPPVEVSADGAHSFSISDLVNKDLLNKLFLKKKETYSYASKLKLKKFKHVAKDNNPFTTEHANLKPYSVSINDTYRKKIQEYLLSDFKDSVDFDDGASEYKLTEKINSRFFLNNSWSIDNTNKPIYNLPLIKNSLGVVDSYSSAKNNSLLSFSNKSELLRPLWGSRPSRKFQDVAGFKNAGTEWPLSYRMHALILPKYSENPIFVSDEEANREYVEARNQNFSRRLNDLSVFGDGFIRELEYFREFNLNPLEYGRFYATPNWEEDEDKVARDRGADMLQRKFNNWRHNKKDANFFGTTESSLEFEDLLINSGYAGNFKIAGGDSQKNLFIAGLGNKFYDVVDTEYFQKKVDWYKPSFFIKQKNKPWGFDYDNNLRWFGSQHWSIQKNLDNFSEMLSSPNYRVLDLELPDLDTYSREILKFKKKDDIFNFLNLNKKKNWNSGYSDWDLVQPYIKRYNKWNFNNFEKIENYNKFNNIDFDDNTTAVISEAGFNRGRNFTEVDLRMNRERSLYNILIMPENYFSTVDRDFGSELKHEWRTKFFQYGKMFKSLEQNVIMQDYYSKYIPLYNRALTPRQIGDYFWMMYKPFKKNKYSRFFKNYETSDRQNPLSSRVGRQTWDLSIKNPDQPSTVELFGDVDGFSDKSDEFPNLGRNWLSVYLKKKMSQKRQNFALSQFETYASPELSFENINMNVPVKRNNIDVRRKLSQSIFDIKTNPENIFTFDATSWKKLLNIMERGDFSKVNKENWWFIAPKKNKNKTLHGGRTSYLLDYLFGTHIKNKKYKNPIFDEENASHRYSAIENLKRKNITKPVKDNFYHKFKNPFSKSLNMLSEIRDVYEVPFDNKFSTIEDLQDSDYFIDSEPNQRYGVASSLNDDISESNDVLFDSDASDSKKSKASFFSNIEYVQSQDTIFGEQGLDSEEYLEQYDYEDFELPLESLADFSSDTLQDSLHTNDLTDKNFYEEPDSDFDEGDDFYNSVSDFFPNQNNSNSWVYSGTIKNNESQDFTKFANYLDYGNISTVESGDDSLSISSTGSDNFDIDDDDEDDDFEFFLDDDSEIADTAPTLDYFYNKKFNTTLQEGAGFNFTENPKIWTSGNAIFSGESSTNNGHITSSYNRSGQDLNLLQPENQSTFYNDLIYKKNRNIGGILPKRKIKSNTFSSRLRSKINRNTFNYVDNSVGLGHVNTTTALFGLELQDFEENLSETSVGNSRYSLKKKKYYPNRISTGSTGQSESMDKFVSERSRRSNYVDFLNEHNQMRDSLPATSLFTKKTNDFGKTGISEIGIDSPIGVFYSKHNIKKKSILPSVFGFSDSIYLKKDTKVEPSFGSDRFKLENLSIADTFSTDTSDLSDKDFFKFGISKSLNLLGKKNLTKSNLQHYFKYRDNLGSVSKSVNNFFFNPDKDYELADTSYIQGVAIPIVKNLTNSFSLPKHTTLQPADENLSQEVQDSDKFFNNSSNYNDEIGSILKNGKQKVSMSNKKINWGPFKLYSSGESIYPLPIQRSLSIDSKLFNKINSLRIYGAGRLNDYFYKPKLKHLLKNQTNFYNFETDFDVDEYGPEDDDFLYRFEDFDTYFNESSDIFNQNQINQKKMELLGLGSLASSGIFTDREKNIEFEELDWNESISSFSLVSDNIDDISGFNDEYDDDTDPIDFFESDEEAPEFLVEDDYEFETTNSEIYNASQTVGLLADEIFDDQQTPDGYFIGLGLGEDDYDDYDYEFLEDFEDLNYLDGVESSDRFFDPNIIDKQDWLLSTYKKLNKINYNSKFAAWSTIDKKEQNLNFFENLDKALDSSRTDNSNWLLQSQLDVDAGFRSWDLSQIGGDHYSTSFDERLLEFNRLNTATLDSAQEEYIFNFKSDEEFDEPFDDYFSELENLQEYLDNRFDGLTIPLERSDRPIWYDRNKFGQDTLHLSFTGLESRKANLDKTSNVFLKQNNNESTKFLNAYTVPKEALTSSEQTSFITRSDLVKVINWNNESAPFSDVLDYYYGNSFKYFSEDKDSEFQIIDKLKNINDQQINLLRGDLGDYFIKNQSEASLRSFNDFYNKKNVWSSPQEDSLYDDDFTFDKDSVFLRTWNLYNSVDDSFVWKNKKELKKIDNLGISEKKNYLTTISDLYNRQGKYIFKKNLLNLKKKLNNDSINNISTLIRKTNTASEAQFGRRKYKKLKKKYWGRLDVLEKYINSIKNSINLNNHSGNLVKNEKYKGKPLQTILSVSNNNNLQIIDFFNNEVEFVKDTDSYLTPSSSPVKNTEDFLDNKDFTRNFNYFFFNTDNLKKKTETLKNDSKGFDKFYNIYDYFENLIDSDAIDISDPLNAELPIDSANYLYFKFKNEDTSTFGDSVLKKDFFRLDELVDSEEEGEDSFTSYSKLRNTFSKLQIGKFSNSYLPVTAVSTFLSSIPNISTFDYLQESPKSVNFFINKKNNSLGANSQIPEFPNFVTDEHSFSKLNTIDFFNKPLIIDQFGIYHKDIQRPGLELKNRFSRLPIAPFRMFGDFDTLVDKSNKYGIGDYVFKNSPVTRRTFELVTRKFGPDFRTNSTMAGYGQLSDISDFNLNSEEDSGLHNGLGYPALHEENRFVYDFYSGLDAKFGGSSIFTNKFLGFIWKSGISPNRKLEDSDQFSFSGEDVPIFGHFSSDADRGVSNLDMNLLTPLNKSVLTYGKVISSILKKKSFSEVNYNFEPNFSRYVQTWTGSIPRKYKSRDGFLNKENESYYEDPMYEHLFSQSYSEEEMSEDEDHSYAHGHWANLPTSILSSLELSTGKLWDSVNSENITGPFFEKDVTAKLANNLYEKNIGPLGYEEGDSLYDNRLLNRGWFPEKIAWSLAGRSSSRVGSDQSTLELLSDYGHSFAHRIENFGISPDLEALKSLDWAGRGNKIFNAVDDILEGFGVEENIPFKPSKARQLFEWEDNLERPTYDFYDFDDFSFMEDDEEFIFSNWKDPEEYHRFKNDNFSTLPMINYLAETNAWSDSNYFGNTDSAYIPGVSLALADNNIYDGLVSDFTHFEYEKFPQNPSESILQSSLPLVTNNLYSNSDFVDSELPEFSNYVLTEPMNELWNTSDGLENQKRNLESKFNMLETFKPKDTFNFSPNPAGTLLFDPEWVVNGEGWLGNVGSTVPIVSPLNIPFAYLFPETTTHTQPAGVHSFSLRDDLDMFGGEDSAYFTLSDYQRSRIVRGRDNDVSNFPINTSWDFNSKLVPNSLNTAWSHRLGGRSHVDFEEGNQDFMLDLQNWSEFGEVVGILSGEGYQLSNSIEDNPDYIIFDQSAINQRNLWWKSIEGGHLSSQSRAELAQAMVSDRSEAYRDFLTSYDFKIFGKSWVNPQETKLPFKSPNFLGDSQINEFLSSSETGFRSNSEIFSEQTYGNLASTASNWEQIPNYFSITLRPLLFKIYNFTIYYLFNWYSVLNGKIFINFYFVTSYFYFKLDFLVSILKIYANTGLAFNYWLYFYPIKLFFSFFKILVSVLNFLMLFIVKFQSFLLTTTNDNSFVDFYLLFTIKNYVLVNFKVGTFFFYKKFLLNLFLFFFLYVVFVFILILL